MAKNTSLPIDSLDFDGIKANLKTYLESQDVFQDYDFEGSGLNILLDILAYNTHYQAFYNNMSISEAFIDSATRNDSIYSLLKLINYTPSSIVASVATVDIIYRGTDIPFDDAILPEKSSFTGAPKDRNGNGVGTSYPFTNPSSVQFIPCSYNDSGEPNEWIAENVQIVQGTFSEFEYIYDRVLGERYQVPNANSDNRWLRIFVKDSEVQDNTVYNEWKRSNTIVDLDETSKVYFLQMGLGGNFEFEFGDDVISKRPDNGSVIAVEYLVTSGSDGNGIGRNDQSGSRVFTLTSGEGDGTFEVVTKSRSTGGAAKETSTFSKRFGPKSFQSQNRLVTAEDYQTEILRRFPLVKSVIVYGGEQETPPQYGKVFIVANTRDSVALSESEKNGIIRDIIKNKKIVSVIPEFIDVDNTYVRVVLDVKYNDAYTALSSDALKSQIRSKIQSYTDTTLEDFGSSFRGSAVIRDVITTSPSIVSVNLLANLEKRIDPTLFLGVIKDYQTVFPNGVYKKAAGSSISSNAFTVDGVKSYLQDNGSGVVQLYTVDAKGRRVVTKANQGTIDYTTGIVKINGIKIQNVLNDSVIRLYATSKNNDIEVSRNQILVIDEQDSTSVIINMSLSDGEPI